jgi:hypothetical protein
MAASISSVSHPPARTVSVRNGARLCAVALAGVADLEGLLR